eukprot:PhF_6_TR33688/c0_g2_i2/m.49378/K14079/PAPD4, GLD2; poly(A) RNA polymerase GLD2
MYSYIGSIALGVAMSADGGPQLWHQACRTQEQLQLCCDHVSHGKEHILVSGELIALGVWDGLSCVELASINLTKMKKTGATQVPSEKVELDKVASMNSCLHNVGLSPESLFVTTSKTRCVTHKRSIKPTFLAAPQNTVTVKFRKPFLNMKQQEIINLINVNNVPYRWCQPYTQAMAFTFDSVDDTIRFALAVPEVALIQYVTPSYMIAPELFSTGFELSFRAFGVRSSWLLRHYLMQHQCARLGAIVIKKWAKNTGFSDSRNGYLTSYAAVILWIFYLLEHNYITNFVSPRDIPSIPPGSESLRGLYQPLLDEHDAHDPQELQHELGTLLHGFYKYYGAEFDWETRVVSLNHRGGSTKERLGWTLDKQVTSADHIADNVFYLLCIEDPYEDNLNLGRRIDDVKFGRIVELFRNAVVGLESPEPGNSPVFRKPTPMDQETASSRILQAIADSLAENTKSGGNGLAIDKLAREVCSKHYEAWSAIQEKYENRISNLLWEKGKKIAYVQDRLVLPAKPRVVRGHEVTSRAGGRMPCDQCRKMSQKLWYAANQKEDPGAYCDSCWNKYESA